MARVEWHYSAWQGLENTTLHSKTHRGTNLHGKDKEGLVCMART